MNFSRTFSNSNPIPLHIPTPHPHSTSPLNSHSQCKASRIGGDVSQKKNPKDTAPALEDCVPLAVDDATRWKANVFTGTESVDTPSVADSDELVLKKSMLVLNKLSLTKFDKLSDAYVATGVGRNEFVLKEAVNMIVEKAQSETHFSAMYASLCMKLSRTAMEVETDKNGGKRFKELLLLRCQSEFEKSTEESIAQATVGITDKEEIEYHKKLVKKYYLGHMQFIGELYKVDLIKYKILTRVTPPLLGFGAHATLEELRGCKIRAVDEEKIECFVKLMLTVGNLLEAQCKFYREKGKPEGDEIMNECWRVINGLAKKSAEFPSLSSRVVFLLQELLEVRSNRWVERRQKEEAKTLQEIHADIAKEENKNARHNRSGPSSSSSSTRPRKTTAR